MTAEREDFATGNTQIDMFCGRDTEEHAATLQPSEMGWNHRHSGILVPAWHGLGEARYAGDLVVDPFCGSGTTCEAALITGRRFIGIGDDPLALEAAYHRCMAAIEEGRAADMRNQDGTPHQVRVKVAQSAVGVHAPGGVGGIDWTRDSYLILGDCLRVMRDMPKDIADLIYADGPYNTGKVFKISPWFFKWLAMQRSKRPWPELPERRENL